MRKISRRQQINKQIIKDSNFLTINEAIELLKKTANTKFNETVEVHVNLNIDPKYADQQLRTTMTLPHGTGKELTIAVLSNESNFEEAKLANADIVGSDELIANISQGNINFDLLIVTPDIMPKLAKLGRILGPKGLMPSPKAGTVTTNLTNTINEFKKGKFEYKADKTGIVHISFGKASFSNEQLVENLRSVYLSIEQNRPPGVKGKYFKSLYVCNSMGPSIQLPLDSFN